MSKIRRHTHLDGTEHSGTPTAAPPGAAAPRGAGPGLVDGRMLLVALIVCLPAGYRLAEGLVSLTDVLTRYLVVAVGCIALAAVVRVVWPILSGESPAATSTLALAAARASKEPAKGRTPARPAADPFAEDLDEFDDDPATLLASGLDDDNLELSSLPD
jgi:hypothetical protein